MAEGNAILIGFQDQGNLGLGYLASTLNKRGFASQTLDFREGREAILKAICEAKPLLVGFSLIFQYFLPQFGALATYLRQYGVNCHFCVGGHFPSLRYEEVLRTVPEIDSVIRCEGEPILAELMECIAEGRDWRGIQGIAYRADGDFVTNPMPALIGDLDSLPWPERPSGMITVLGRTAAPLLASRGCARNCSFCSIREFYGLSSGRKVRVRNAEKVVEEMEWLHNRRGVSIFLFQDDDFPIRGMSGRSWVDRFLNALHESELAKRIVWKISCRADEVEAGLFARMREAGLYMVYLGLESGNPTGLQTLNKGLRVEDSLEAVATLKSLDLFVAYGFMLFDPSSTFESIRANVTFLKRITADGTMAAHFCRMLPYAGTPIERQLAQEGRLRGTVVEPDYDFHDARLNGFFEELNRVTEGWIHGRDSMVSQLNWAWQEYWIIRRLFPPLPSLAEYESSLRELVGRANSCLLGRVERMADVFEGKFGEDSALKEQMRSEEFRDQLILNRNAFVLGNQVRMLEALGLAA